MPPRVPKDSQNYTTNFRQSIYGGKGVRETIKLQKINGSELQTETPSKSSIIKAMQHYIKKNKLDPVNVTFQFVHQNRRNKRGDLEYGKQLTIDQVRGNEYYNSKMEVTGDAVEGSDSQVDSEYRVLGKSFIASYVRPSTGSCNVNKACQRVIKSDDEKLCFHVFSPYSKKGRCFYAAIENLGVQHSVKVADQKPVSLQEAVQILGDSDVCIVSSLAEDGKIIVLHHGKTENCKSLLFAYDTKKQEWHWFVLEKVEENQTKTYRAKRDEVKTKKEERMKAKKEKDTRQELFVFYDLETVFDEDKQGLAQAYSAVYFACTRKEFLELEMTPQNLSSFEERCVVFSGEGCVGEMIEDFCQKYPADEFKKVLCGFNSSSFDDYFVLQYVSKQILLHGSISTCFSGKSMLGLQVGAYFRCWDLRKFLTLGNLKTLTRGFNCFPQKYDDSQMGFTFEDVELAYKNKESWKKFIEQTLPTVIQYNKIDVLSLLSLTQKFYKASSQLTQKIDTKDHIFKHSTIGQQIYKLAQKYWKNNSLKVSCVESEEMDLFIRKSLTAGRTEVMASPDRSPYVNKGVPLAMVDVVSLYPFAMMSPDNFYPIGEPQWVQQRDEDKLGFYEVSVKQLPDVRNVLPYRSEDVAVPLDWKCKGQFITNCSSVDIDVLLKAGHSVEVIRGLEFPEKVSGAVMFGFLRSFIDEKNQQDLYAEALKMELPDAKKSEIQTLANNALRETCKLYANSCSGKVIQRNMASTSAIVNSEKEIEDFEAICEPGSVKLGYVCQGFTVVSGKKIQVYNTKSAKPSQVGVCIYSWARKHMYENVYTHVNCLYTDTDSLLFPREQLERIPKHLFEKEVISFTDGVFQGMTLKRKVLGKLDSELSPEMDNCILLAPKNYCVYGFKNGVVKFDKLKAKGVSFKGSSCRYSDEVLLSDNPLRFFEEYLDKGFVEVDCEQFRINKLTEDYSKGKQMDFGVKKVIVRKTIKNTLKKCE